MSWGKMHEPKGLIEKGGKAPAGAAPPPTRSQAQPPLPPTIGTGNLTVVHAQKRLCDDLLALIDRLALSDPRHETGNGDMTCIWCDATEWSGNPRGHEADCPWVEAREVLDA